MGWLKCWTVIPSTPTQSKVPPAFTWPAELLRLLSLAAVFFILDRALNVVGRLPTEAYANPVLLTELLQRIGIVGFGVIVVAAALLIRFGHLPASWKEYENGGVLRGFLLILAALIAWPFLTLAFNYYFEQGYLWDRALLLLLLAGCWFRPVLIIPFTLLAIVLMYQLVQPPLGGSILAHKQQVLRVLTAFGATLLVHSLNRTRRDSDFVLLTCCVVAGAYWEAALAKMELNWISYGHLYHALFSAHAHGWLASFDGQQIADFAKWLARIDLPLRVFVLVIEAGCLFFLWRRLFAVALLSCLILFHLGVFAVFGFLFWPWIGTAAALLALLLVDGGRAFSDIHARSTFLISVPLIATAGLWVHPPHLGWFDSRLSYTLGYTVIGESGRAYALSPRYFEPYGDVFTMATFPYLVRDHQRLTGVYGVTKRKDIAELLHHARTAEDIFELERSHGRNRFSAADSARWQDFVRHYLQVRNAQGDRLAIFDRLHPPPQFWVDVTGNAYRGQEPMQELIVTERTRLFDGERSQLIREIELARIQLIVPDH